VLTAMQKRMGRTGGSLGLVILIALLCLLSVQSALTRTVMALPLAASGPGWMADVCVSHVAETPSSAPDRSPDGAPSDPCSLMCQSLCAAVPLMVPVSGAVLPLPAMVVALCWDEASAPLAIKRAVYAVSARGPPR